MIAYQRETLFEVMGDVEPLLQMHHDELALDRDRIALSPRWDRYNAMESAGLLLVFTARESRALIGYAAFFLYPHMHCDRLTVAANDVLFLHPDCRKGSAGLKFLRFCESEIKKQPHDGVLKIAWSAKPNSALESLLPRLDYATEETVFTKIL